MKKKRITVYITNKVYENKTKVNTVIFLKLYSKVRIIEKLINLFLYNIYFKVKVLNKST